MSATPYLTDHERAAMVLAWSDYFGATEDETPDPPATFERGFAEGIIYFRHGLQQRIAAREATETAYNTFLKRQ